MPRLAIVLGVVALALAFATEAGAQRTQLLPSVFYQQDVQFTPHGPVAIHVVQGPRPTGLYRLRPALSNESVTGLERVTSIEKRMSAQASAVVGINGDYYSFRDGRPSGILMRDRVLVSAPEPGRSSAGITLDGLLDVRKTKLSSSWQGVGPRRPVAAFNEAPGPNDVALFTSDWGSATPPIPGALAVVLSPFPAASPGVDLVAPVADALRADSVGIAPGTAVLVARGNAATRLESEAPLGAALTIRLYLQSGWDAVLDAIGGGPALVRDGRPVFDANEAFTRSQLVPRHPRTAVGQTADGRVLLVAVDGRQVGYSVGMTNFEMAQTMMRLGADRAMALDGGGSTTLAFDGAVLNKPSEGRERPVSTALMLLYSGIYARLPSTAVVSPNGDGVDEKQKLSYKLVRPSEVTVTLTAPDGSVAFQDAGARQPGTYEVAFPPAQVSPPGVPPTPPPEPLPIPEGRWSLTVSATDDQGSASTSTREFWVNTTLGFLRVVPKSVRLRPPGAEVRIQWAQAHPARVTVRVETMQGVVLKRVAQRVFARGPHVLVWNGRRRDGKLAYGGRYRILVSARNAFDSVSLEQTIVVRRVRPK